MLVKNLTQLTTGRNVKIVHREIVRLFNESKQSLFENHYIYSCSNTSSNKC